MRLIDADRLLTDRMKSKYYHLPNGDIAIPLIDIEHAPTIEPDLSSYSDKLWRNAYERGRKEAMEEIIHCRDCRWRNDQNGSTAWVPCRAIVTPSDFYCGRAERRTDDKTNKGTPC
jgi:hypothetical protein